MEWLDADILPSFLPSLLPRVYYCVCVVLPVQWSCVIIHDTQQEYAHTEDILCVAFGAPNLMATASFDGQVRTCIVHVLMEVSYKLLSPPPNCFLCADYCVGHHFLSDSHTIEGSPSRHLITTHHWLAWSGVHVASPHRAILYHRVTYWNGFV